MQATQSVLYNAQRRLIYTQRFTAYTALVADSNLASCLHNSRLDRMPNPAVVLLDVHSSPCMLIRDFVAYRETFVQRAAVSRWAVDSQCGAQ